LFFFSIWRRTFSPLLFKEKGPGDEVKEEGSRCGSLLTKLLNKKSKKIKKLLSYPNV